MLSQYVARLTDALNQAGVVFESVDSNKIITFLPSTTAAHKAAAFNILATVDPSAAADEAYVAQQIKTVAGSNLDTPADSDNKLIRALALVVLDEVNLLRQAAGLSQRTPAQLINAIKAKL